MARLKKLKFNNTSYEFPVEDVKVGTTSVVTDGVATIDLSGKADDNAVVKLTGNQTIAGTKTFSTSPVVPSKTSDATNTGTAIATESQVYKKQDALVSGTNIKTINGTSVLGSGNIEIESGTEYNAGEGIEIKNGPDYSAMQGPAPDGFHVPLTTEWQAVKTIWTSLGGGNSDGTNFGIALKLPFAGRRNFSSAGVDGQGTKGRYWSSSRYNANNAYLLSFSSDSLTSQSYDYRTNGYSVRCFKNFPVTPTSSWTKLYGTSIETGGIFWDGTDGLISLSSDGQTWITIADKNLGATTVWNSGDTLSEANCGKYYQWGNNYGFPRTGTIANQSTTQVDASNYGPGNYYSSDTFIKYSGRWDTTDNGNLRGGVTGVVTLNNAITNTGVLSVNGQTGDVTISTPEESNTKTFYLSSTSDLTNAQAAYDWYVAGKNPIIAYANSTYTLYDILSGQMVFRSTIMDVYDDDNNGYSSRNIRKLSFGIVLDTVTNITSDYSTVYGDFLRTGKNYTTPYTPQYNGSPATKKYVDDSVSGKQATLVSGTNIKTINNTSLLGSGNIEIESGAEYNAGEGIAIGTIHSDMQGPCPDGFHVPIYTEWVALCGVLTTTFSLAQNATTMGTYLKMPMAGYRSYNSNVITSDGYYWSSSAYSAPICLKFTSSSISSQYNYIYSDGCSIRCFKNKPEIPTSSWATLYDGSSVASGAGIFYNATDGLISVSGDGTTWYTIQDKNLGATTVYNQGDTVNDANSGYFYQWGNNYGFAHSGTVTTSRTKVDATNYGPGNYYSSSTFITGSGNWSSVQNNNLWGGVSQGTWVTDGNTITNTGVLSVNGQTGDISNVVTGNAQYVINVSTTAPSSGTASNIITIVTD